VTVARASSVPAYVVFTDATLVAIAETRPASLAELAGISGVGVRKLETHGAAVLEVLAGGDPELVAQSGSPTTKSAPEAPPAEKKSRNRNK
jgi:hypothetical protein